MFLVLVLTSCPTPVEPSVEPPATVAPFVLDQDSLKGRTLTYAISGNGKDKAVLAFSEDGKSGSFEILSYTYSFATVEAQTAGTYTDRSWFQRGGQKGSFSYDAATREFVMSVLQEYRRKEGVTTSFAADYEYMDLAKAKSLDYRTTYASYASTMAGKALFTQDQCSLFHMLSGAGAPSPRGKMAESLSLAVCFADDSGWSTQLTTTDVYTENGSTYTEMTIRRTEVVVSETALSVKTSSKESVSIDGGPAQALTTRIDAQAFSVVSALQVGNVDEPKPFADTWKDGAAVTFRLLNAKEETIQYSGNMEPAAPAVGPDGYGRTQDGNNSYRIDCYPYPAQLTIVRQAGLIGPADFFSAASRGY